MSKSEDFNYHYRCNHLKLNYLIFADDLMLFYKGEVNSIVLMVGALKAFSDVSGLSAKKEKNAICFGNVKDEIKQRIV